MPKVLVVSGARYGSPDEIADVITDVLQQHGLSVTRSGISEAPTLSDCDAVVFGSAVYSDHFRRAALRFAGSNGAALRGRPVWVFSSGPLGVRRDVIRDWPAIRNATGAHECRIFAGRRDHRVVSLTARVAAVIQDLPSRDDRDWADVRRWAESIAGALTSPKLGRAG